MHGASLMLEPADCAVLRTLKKSRPIESKDNAGLTQRLRTIGTPTEDGRKVKHAALSRANQYKKLNGKGKQKSSEHSIC
jgi:hypothetical protein